MINAHEIVAQVQERFRGLPGKLSRLFGKSEVWWRSHSYLPKKFDEYANGNPSEVEHYIAFAEQYEAAQRGAGQMLNEFVYLELKSRFLDSDSGDQHEIKRDVFQQCTEAGLALDEKTVGEASDADLGRWETELSEADEAISRARALVRDERRLRKIKSASNTTLRKFAAKR